MTGMRPAASSSDPELVESLRSVLSRLPGVTDAVPCRSGLRVEYPDSEFIVSVKADVTKNECCADLTAMVRAHPPELDTWWSSSTAYCRLSDVADCVTEELTMQRATFFRLLDEARMTGTILGSEKTTADSGTSGGSGARRESKWRNSACPSTSQDQ
jgi:hypothetical protein